MTQSTAPITTEISTSSLTYEPGQTTTFDVTVRNQSDRFAAFRVEVLAVGADQSSTMRWYRLAPEVSSKIPPGDSTRFQMELLTVPPVPDGFTGTMNLTVRVYSIELQTEDRQVLRLIIKGTGYLPPRLTLVTRKLQAYPTEQVTIPVSVVNPNRQAVDVVVRLNGLPQTWLPDGIEQHLHLLAKGSKDLAFICQLPSPPQAPSQDYPLTLEAFQPNAPMSVYAEGRLTVMPAGYVEFRCQPTQQTVPETLRRWWNPRVGQAVIDLVLDNQSNVSHQAMLFAQYPSNARSAVPKSAVKDPAVKDPATTSKQPKRSRRWAWLWFWKQKHRKSDDLAALNATSDGGTNPGPTEHQEILLSQQPLDPTLNLSAREMELPLDTPVLQTLTIRQKLPWLGWPRAKTVEIQSTLMVPRTDLRNDTKTVYLEIFPLVPIWLQTVLGLILILLLGLGWWKVNQVHHQAAVTSVQLNGQADEVASVAKDGDIRLWSIRGRRLRSAGVLNQGDDRAVRVVRYRPVDNDQVIIGFENGELETWNLLLKQPQLAMSFDRDDRVFDIAIPPDAHSLYSGHGSGTVVQWNVQPEDEVPLAEPLRGFDVRFAIQALTLVGTDRQHLAIAGRNNRLVLINLATEQPLELNYPYGGGNDFITRLDSPSDRPTLLAVSDNQGRISIWDLQSCLATGTSLCNQIDEWSSGHNGRAVRAIAFSADGCFLASSGDDGQVKLWPLTPQGRRLPAIAEGKVVKRFDIPINAVDLARTHRHLKVASGAENGYVRLNTIRLRSLPEESLACSRF
ncbi:MAG: hypothetical protein F6K09_01500 [Merismopedia sp. SIO2A8]|nr:hypothetical protein [Merismopedia sp. SIO2A8]